MNKGITVVFVIIQSIMIITTSCNNNARDAEKIRDVVDTVGFAQYDWQMDSIIARINRYQDSIILTIPHHQGQDLLSGMKAAISPHDDYSYVGWLYPHLLDHLKANTIILFGVAHKAKQLGLADMIVFDSFDLWKGPYSDIKVSGIREEIIQELPEDIYEINDSMHTIEHSLEALLPFLQYYNRKIEILPILVPYMDFNRMTEISKHLSAAIYKTAGEKQWEWGRDYAIVISSDAVHYGDEDWGGKNFARYGADTSGYYKAVEHEMEIIEQCLVGEIIPEKVRKFTGYTVRDDDYREYKWTWCGRYSIPLGLLTCYELQDLRGGKINGVLTGYSTSIADDPVPVEDLQMGVTAPANIRHWVGYAAVEYY